MYGLTIAIPAGANTMDDKISAKEKKQEATRESSIGDELARQGILGGEDINKSLAIEFGMPIYLDLLDFRISKERLKQVPYNFAKKNVIYPIKEEDGIVFVAISDPLHLEPLEELRLMLDSEVKAVYSPRDAILAALNELYNREHGAASELIANLGDRSDDGREGEVEVYDLLDDAFQQAPIVKLLNLIVT